MEKMAKPRVMHFQWRGKIFGYTMWLSKYSMGVIQEVRMDEQPTHQRPTRAGWRLPANKRWLVVAYVIFAAYLIYDGFIFLLNPYSGRLSTFVCAPDSGEKMVCTVTIYGLRGISRRSFPAEDFVSASEIIEGNGSSSNATHGIIILTKQGPIDFIPEVETGRYIQELREKINSQFIDGEPIPPISITHFRPHPSFYQRALSLAVGLVLLLLALRARRDWLGFDDTRLGQRAGFWRFAIYWSKNNILVRLIFHLLLLLGSGVFGLEYLLSYRGAQSGFLGNCFTVIQAHPEYFAFPWGYFLCLYRLFPILLLQGVVQRQMLARVNLRVSRWWVAAPLAASLPLMVIVPDLICDDCELLAWGFYSTVPPFTSPMWIGLGVFYLLTGVIQWLVLRRQLASPAMWVIMPIANPILSIAFHAIDDVTHVGHWVNQASAMGYDVFWFAMILAGQIVREVVPAMYMSWLVNRKSPGLSKVP
jgi:hypothetical protein